MSKPNFSSSVDVSSVLCGRRISKKKSKIFSKRGFETTTWVDAVCPLPPDGVDCGEEQSVQPVPGAPTEAACRGKFTFSTRQNIVDKN